MKQPSKFTTLKNLAELGFSIPPMMYLTHELIINKTNLTTSLDHFIHTHPYQQYIVRSAVSVEDQPQLSWAGHFESSGPAPAEHLLETVRSIFDTNLQKVQALRVDATVAVFIMPYIVAVRGGVAFTPWHYFYRHSLVAHAPTPADATAGTQAENELLDHTYQMHHEAWKNRLATCLNTLQHQFTYPIDIEWVDDGLQTWILQVRPVTVMPLATSVRETMPVPTGFTHTPFSRAFGKLSPVSFSLYTQLYEKNAWLTHLLDIRSGASFMSRLSTGQVLVNEVKQKEFFSNRHWYSAFIRPLRAATTTLHTKDFEKQQSDLEIAKQTFARWQTAAAMPKASASTTLPQEYELTTAIDPTCYTRPGEVERCKRAFMEAIQPFRELVAHQPELAWGEINNDGTIILPDTWEEHYAAELAYSTQWYASSLSTSTHWSHETTLPSSLPKLYINYPETWATPLPQNTIIVTPRIPNTWIPQLPYLAGIITSELAPLSHAAIVLREHNIPTQVTQSLPTH